MGRSEHTAGPGACRLARTRLQPADGRTHGSSGGGDIHPSSRHVSSGGDVPRETPTPVAMLPLQFVAGIKKHGH
eukprot:3425374-Prymnesium_polylepis.1